MKRLSLNQRRATILLMVVSLLALLFVIITGFLNLARNGRETVTQTKKGDEINRVMSVANELAVSEVAFPRGQALDPTQPNLIMCGNSRTYYSADIPGYGNTFWLASANPVWDGTRVGTNPPNVAPPNTPSYKLALNTNQVDLWQLRYPAVTALEPVTDTTQPDPRNRRAKPIQPFIISLFPEDATDMDSVFNAAAGQGDAGTPASFRSGFEMARQAANGYMDATGAGVPDSHLLAGGMVNEMAAEIAGVNLNLPRFDFTLPLNPANVPMPPSPTGISTMPLDPNNPASQVAVGFQEAMKRFYASSPYVVSTRIISHGGMVTLDSPQLVYKVNGSTSNQPLPWNRRFVTDLFNAIHSPNDKNYPAVNDQKWNGYLTGISKDSAAVEGDLRRRGGMLANFREFSNQYDLAAWSALPREPSALQAIEQAFPNTFLPAFRDGVNGPAFARKKDNYQRFNMGISSYDNGNPNSIHNDRAAFSNGAAINPYLYSATPTAVNDTKATFITRSALTSQNNSDEISRKQDPADRKYVGVNQQNEGAPLLGGIPEIYRGGTKFWLGELKDAFIEDPARPGSWSFDTRGISGTSVDPVGLMPKSRSDLVIEKLAGYFYDMLASNDTPPAGIPPAPFTLDPASVVAQWDDMSNPTPPAGKEVVSRLQQAFMMAVNAAAWAAPRDPLTSPTPGFVDGVVYPSQPFPGTAAGARYVGYGPQPFITEAICYDADPSATHTNTQISFAVEIYNPGDPSADPAANADVFGLWLPGFGISVADASGTTSLMGTTPITTPPTAQRMSGRTFRTVVLHGPSNNSWPTISDPNTMHDIPTLLDFPYDSKFTLTLWRAKRQPLTTGVKEWLPVDRIQIDGPTNLGANGQGAWTAGHRDTSPTPFFAVMGTTPARWSVATEMGLQTGSTGQPLQLSLGNEQFLDNGGGASAPTVQAPITPFPTMSAGIQSDLRLFAPAGLTGGCLPRPRSFPTVGFMTFLPRYSHALLATAGGGQPLPVTMSDLLHRQWVSKGYNAASKITGYPLDFGHMPLFDNKMNIALTNPVLGAGNPQPASIPPSSFMQETGPLPWGQLVFDYFTVINPNLDLNGDGSPDLDPLKIPGRININTAPWQVLMNIPLIGPMASTPPGYMPLRVNNAANPAGILGQDPSPSFWMPLCGVLTGTYTDPNVSGGLNYRFMGTFPSGAFPRPQTGGPPAAVVYADGQWSMGPWLAWSAASYRDGIQYVPNTAGNGAQYYRDSNLRGFTSPNGALNSGVYVGYRPTQYGVPPGPNLVNGAAIDHGIRGQAIFDPVNPAVIPPGPREFGFVTIGELLNAKGWDSSFPLDTPALNELADPSRTTVGKGDFIKAVSLVALLDTAFLTTRSNTYTVYTSVIDRQNPENSLRSQITLDRSNMLPRLVFTQGPLITVGTTPVTINIGHNAVEGAAHPTIVQQRTVGYFNAKYDD